MESHRAITDYFRQEQDRIRELIGSDHWLTDGVHKELLVRKVLKDKLPSDYQVGQGFVRLPCVDRGEGSQQRSSGQLDVLVTRRDVVPLYGKGDQELCIICPQDALAVLEVKTHLPLGSSQKNRGNHTSVLKLIADRAERIRRYQQDFAKCWVGLFVYKTSSRPSRSDRYHLELLRTLQEVTENHPDRVINCIAIGPDVFVRYWPSSHSQVAGPAHTPAWHSYYLQDMAQPYLVSNLIVPLLPHGMDSDNATKFYPIPGGKERLRQYVASLDGSVPQRVPSQGE